MAFLLNDYKDLKEIARGGMGKVYLGTQISLNRKVIIKEMASGLLADPTEIKRFENEARAAAALNHDNIIRIYDFGEDRGSFYISMEYIDGADLDFILKNTWYLPEIGLMIVLHALKGLNFAHQQGIIHRDLKPGNILVSKAGAVKVVDFGLAHASHQQLHLTTKNMIVGTPIFMSPEQATGEEKKDARMDIWAAGILLYRILSNAYPFTGDNVPALLVKILQNQQPPIQELTPSLPDDLAEMINQCLEKDRDRRLQSLEPLIEMLQNHFFDMEIKDTSTWIRRYESDPESCVKDLSLVLIEYHVRKENEFRIAGNEEKAAAHLQEAKRYESKELPINIVRDAIKKRDTSAIFKKSPHLASAKKNATTKPAYGKSAALIGITAFLILIAMLAGGWFVYSRIAKKSVQDSVLLAYNTEKKQSSAAPRPAIDSARQKMPAVSDTVAPALATPSDRTKNRTVPHGPALSIKKSFPRTEPHKEPKPPQDRNIATPSVQPAAAAQETTQQQTPPAQTSGFLKVTVTPATAEVTINGEKISLRELTGGKRFKPGTYTIVANAPGYEQYSKTVTLEKGDVQIISANLVVPVKEPAALHIYSSPWAEIYIDGAFSGNSPTSKPIYLVEGPHMVQLKRSGFKTYEEVITITNGELKRMKIRLEEAK